MKLVVDTNIVFSAILNTNSNIGQILFNNSITFYSCAFLQTELYRHKEKILKLTRLSEEVLNELILLVIRNIIFINENVIPPHILKEAEKLVSDIDADDTVFVAMAMYQNCMLWTGDKALSEGLKRKGIERVVNTNDLMDLLKR